ncbi:hypothetical protein [Echinicola rosea]|uniref:hypothetical protein n=1 Tax=Echinicola rosea TaxID=1807691 RepID=UPI001E641211|nr:hypothetical protein [Echinicola rosea]
MISLVSCGKSEKRNPTGPTAKLKLEVVDSLIVDELEPLVMDDHRSDLGYYLLRNTKSRQPLLVDEQGTVIQEFDILNEGPDGIGSFGTGYRLLNDTSWVAQNLMTGFYLYDYQGKRKKHLPSLQKGIFSITINTNRTTFHPFMKNGAAYILGEESNAFDHKAIDPEKLGADFYTTQKRSLNMR